MWTPSAQSYSWKPIGSAPLDEDVTLQVTDGRGKPYTLRNPSRLTAAGWVSSGKGTPLAVTPVRWRPYHGSPPPDDIPPLPDALACRQGAGGLCRARREQAGARLPLCAGNEDEARQAKMLKA
jgi:hypothetical protein